MDESVGGFAVQSDEPLNCHVGDTLLVEIALAWVEVRVVNIHRPESSPENSDDGAAVLPTRLNLARLRDVDESEANPDELPLLSWARFRTALVPLVPLGRSFRGTAAMIVAIFAAGIVIVWALENSVPLANAMREGAQKSDKETRAAKEPFVPDQRDEKPAESKSTTAPAPVETKTGETSVPDEPKANDEGPAKTNLQMPEKMIRLAQPDFLLNPDVTRRLSLNPQQREQLRKLFEEYRAASEAAALANRGAGGTLIADDAILQLGRRGLEILSDEQRRSLRQLQAAMESAQKSDATSEPATERTGEPPPSGQRPASP